jgi:hypothetical protein
MGVYWDGDGIVKLADVQAGMGQEYPRDYPFWGKISEFRPIPWQYHWVKWEMLQEIIESRFFQV